MLWAWLRAHASDVWQWAVIGGSGPSAFAVATGTGSDNATALMVSLVAACVLAVLTGQLIPKPKHVADLKFREDLMAKQDALMAKQAEQFDRVMTRESAATVAVESLRAEVQRINARSPGRPR